MNQHATLSYRIKRRSSAHSAYWLSNALVPIGLIMMYKYGWSVEAGVGLFFVGLGAVGYGIYKQKMSVPLIECNSGFLTHRPSASKPGTIKMDSNAVFTVGEYGLVAESRNDATETIEISALNFNSLEDWQLFIDYLRKEPEITLRFEH